MMEQYSNYKFEIFEELVPVWTATGKTDKTVNGYIYKIYGEGCLPYDDGVIESSEWFDTEQVARFAAIGHITLLENGEG
jgi:hypothetical protein